MTCFLDWIGNEFGRGSTWHLGPHGAVILGITGMTNKSRNSLPWPSTTTDYLVSTYKYYGIVTRHTVTARTSM